MHFEVRKMKNHDKCLKCGSASCEVKTIAMPTKKLTGAKISLDTFYLKICQNCGYTEMYSTKVIEKAKDPIKNY